MAAIDEQDQQILSGVGSLQERESYSSSCTALLALHGRKAPSANGAATLTQEQRTRASRTVSTAPTGGGMHDAAAGTADVWCHSRRCSASLLSPDRGVGGFRSRAVRRAGPELIPLLCICTYYVGS